MESVPIPPNTHPRGVHTLTPLCGPSTVPWLRSDRYKCSFPPSDMWDNLLSPETPCGWRAGTEADGSPLLMEDVARHVSHMRFLSTTLGNRYLKKKKEKKSWQSHLPAASSGEMKDDAARNKHITLFTCTAGILHLKYFDYTVAACVHVLCFFFFFFFNSGSAGWI